MFHIFQGDDFKDSRGEIRFVNNFDMKDVKRFYIIKNLDCNFFRGWRAHQFEQRWFFVLKGSFTFAFVKIDNWKNPDRNSPISTVNLKSNQNQLIHVPNGFGTAFKALEPNSEVLVYADNYLHNSSLDDYSYSMNYFNNLKTNEF